MPLTAGDAFCPHWRKKFGWVRTGDGRLLPLGCNKWTCSACGPRKKSSLQRQLEEGWRASGYNQQGLRPALITLTWRWKVNGLHPDDPAAFRSTQARTRWNYSDQEWSDYITWCISLLRKRWARHFGTPLTYFGVIEMTKQRCPHVHMVAVPPIAHAYKGSEAARHIEKWLRHAWMDITGDSPQAQYKPYDERARHTTASAFGYALKYTLKSEGELPKGWRRFRCSAGFPRAIIGVIEKFTTDKGDVINRWQIRSTMGRWYAYRKKVRDYDRDRNVFEYVHVPDTVLLRQFSDRGDANIPPTPSLLPVRHTRRALQRGDTAGDDVLSTWFTRMRQSAQDFLDDLPEIPEGLLADVLQARRAMALCSLHAQWVPHHPGCRPSRTTPGEKVVLYAQTRDGTLRRCA